MFVKWWASQTSIEQALWIIAIPASFLFVFKLVMALLGIGGDDDVGVGEGDAGEADADLGEASLVSSLFSPRNLLPFFLGFTWGGLALLDYFKAEYAVLGALATGGVVVGLNAALVFSLYSLRSAGNLRVRNAIGKTGVVSVRIPPNGNGYGKVSLSLQGRLVELAAITNHQSRLDRGVKVAVSSIENERLIVTPLLKTE